MNGAHQEEHKFLQELRGALDVELNRLSQYSMKGVRKRLKDLKRGDYEKIIQIEIVIAAHLGRYDLIENLQLRLSKIEDLQQKIRHEEEKDYQGRFNPLNSS